MYKRRDGEGVHSVCFCVLVIVSNVAMNIGVHIFFVLVFFSPLWINAQKWNY